MQPINFTKKVSKAGPEKVITIPRVISEFVDTNTVYEISLKPMVAE